MYGINLLRNKCIYSRGLQIMVYSTLQAKNENIGWHRDCSNITYYPNNLYIFNSKLWTFFLFRKFYPCNL